MVLLFDFYRLADFLVRARFKVMSLFLPVREGVATGARGLGQNPAAFGYCLFTFVVFLCFTKGKDILQTMAITLTSYLACRPVGCRC